MPQLADRARCHCGSGKLYKDCHKAEDVAGEEERRAWDTAYFALRQEFARFAKDERFARAFADAVGLFWDGHYTLENAHMMNEDEALRFFDWFVLDHIPEGGQRLFDVYAAEKGAELDERERALLEAWKQARPASAYVVVELDRPRVHLRDVFTGDEVWVEDAAAAHILDEGETLLGRVLAVNAMNRMAGGAARLPIDEAADLAPEITRARVTFLADHPGATWDDFLRARGYLLTHYAMHQAEAHGREAVRPESFNQAVKNRSVRQLRKFIRR
jgi:hypothetical protein